eukprot:3735043-Pyramimonas_sp.AAC.1
MGADRRGGQEGRAQQETTVDTSGCLWARSCQLAARARQTPRIGSRARAVANIALGRRGRNEIEDGGGKGKDVLR